MSKKIVILSGAGVSAESGIKTFRDSDGLWENYRVEDVASIDGWHKDKKLVLDFYNARRREVFKTVPNEAHKKIAALEKYFEVTVVTQNIDNLHERGGSSNVIHLHGEITKARGEYDDYYSAFEIGDSDIRLGEKSPNPNGGQLRPHIVWFGENVPELDRAAKEVMDADILIIVGTSLVVYPAAGLVRYTKPECKIYLIDPKEVNAGIKCEHIKEKATIGMNRLFDELTKNDI